MNKREQAKGVLVWYFRRVWEESNLRFDYDSRTEIEEIVDLIIDATKEEIRAEILSQLRGGHGFGWLNTED